MMGGESSFWIVLWSGATLVCVGLAVWMVVIWNHPEIQMRNEGYYSTIQNDPLKRMANRRAVLPASVMLWGAVGAIWSQIIDETLRGLGRENNPNILPDMLSIAISLVFVFGLVSWWTVRFSNRPKFLVPPHFRCDSGLREAMSRRVEDSPDRDSDQGVPGEE